MTGTIPLPVDTLGDRRPRAVRLVVVDHPAGIPPAVARLMWSPTLRPCLTSQRLRQPIFIDFHKVCSVGVVKSVSRLVTTLLAEFNPVEGSKLGELNAKWDILLGVTAADSDG